MPSPFSKKPFSDMGAFYPPEKNEPIRNNFIITRENIPIMRMLIPCFP